MVYQLGSITLPYNEKRMLNIMSDLLKIVEEFIGYYVFKQSKFDNDINQLQYFVDNDLHKFFGNKYLKIIEQLDSEKEDYLSQIARYKTELLHVNYQQKFNKRYTDYNASVKALNIFSESQKYKIQNLCLINLNNHTEEKDHESPLSKVHIYLNALLRNRENVDAYKITKENILQLTPFIADEELITVTLIFINYCIDLVNLKKEDFLKELLFWYDFQINKNIILESNNTISSATYKNYITIALRLKLFDQANSFMENFGELLAEEEFVDVYNYNKANLYFHQNKFEEALELLVFIKTDDIFYKLSIRRLMLKIYYLLSLKEQMNYIDVFESNINAFKKYIYTTKEINETIRERNKQFYKFLFKIAKLKPTDKNKRNELYQQILANEHCAESGWLLELLTTN